MDIPYLIKDLFKTKNFQTWINNRFSSLNEVIVDKRLFPLVKMENGLQFSTSKRLVMISQVIQDYDFQDLRKKDIVIDIGANIGGFSILASRMADDIYAVEPITSDELRSNIAVNSLNIKVIEGGLGNGKLQTIEWETISKKVPTFTFSELKEKCGGCNFLKCDCEGYEWFIKPEELEGVRRIEMEMHNYNPSDNDPYQLIRYMKDNYFTTIVKNGEVINEFSMKFKERITDLAILHATRKNNE